MVNLKKRKTNCKENFVVVPRTESSLETLSPTIRGGISDSHNLASTDLECSNPRIFHLRVKILLFLSLLSLMSACAPLFDFFRGDSEDSTRTGQSEKQSATQHGRQAGKSRGRTLTAKPQPKPMLPRFDRVRPEEVRREYSRILDYKSVSVGVLKTFRRAEDDLQELAAILAESQVPSDLLIIPFIESNFNPKAVGPTGAAGIWQFSKDTGRLYGLRVGIFSDERKHLEKSTRAAGRHLRDLYREFHDWPLVLAAYNAGISRVRRACKGATVCDYWVLSRAKKLPPVTRKYVPRMLATLLYLEDKGHWPFTKSDRSK